MFISKSLLQNKFDIDAAIAAFFVDRKVPLENRYWKERLLYVSRGTGYLFIPLYFDLQHRCGLSKDLILDENYIAVTEAILHSAALHESEELSIKDHIDHCYSLVKDRMKQPELCKDLLHYFETGSRSYKNLGTGNMALNRGDALLFALCIVPASKQLINEIIKCWYALVPAFLLIDDIIDLEDDKDLKQENSILEFGEGAEGIKLAIAFLEEKIKLLASVNPRLGPFFEEPLQTKLQTAYLKSICNH